jgi:hypothetical protein
MRRKRRSSRRTIDWAQPLIERLQLSARGRVFQQGQPYRGSKMRAISTVVVTLAVCFSVSSISEAKGCLKGAAVGGVVGHVAGHHAVVGAAAGCVIEHHREKVRDKAAARPAAAPPPALPPPAAPSPSTA